MSHRGGMASCQVCIEALGDPPVWLVGEHEREVAFMGSSVAVSDLPMPQPGDEGWCDTTGYPLAIIAFDGEVNVWACRKGSAFAAVFRPESYGLWTRTPSAPVFPESWINVYSHGLGVPQLSRKNVDYPPDFRRKDPPRIAILHLRSDGSTEMLPPV